MAAEQQQPVDMASQPSTSSSSTDHPMMNTPLTERFKGKYQPLQPPTFEQMMGEDMMNNCGVKCTLSGIMGGALGVAFGIFTASLDTSVRF
jgi:hypothetical protein